MVNLDEKTECAWRNLAQNITRQRLIVEATTPKIVVPSQIKPYLIELARVSNMEIIGGPFTRTAHECGYAGWVHWKTSGCHLYSYPTNVWGGNNRPLLTVDTYTCKPFSVPEVIEFTRDYFKPMELVWQEIKV